MKTFLTVSVFAAVTAVTFNAVAQTPPPPPPPPPAAATTPALPPPPGVATSPGAPGAVASPAAPGVMPSPGVPGLLPVYPRLHLLSRALTYDSDPRRTGRADGAGLASPQGQGLDAGSTAPQAGSFPGCRFSPALIILADDRSDDWKPRPSSRSHRRDAEGDRRDLSRRAVEVVADRLGLEGPCKLGEGQGRSVKVAA